MYEKLHLLQLFKLTMEKKFRCQLKNMQSYVRFQTF